MKYLFPNNELLSGEAYNFDGAIGNVHDYAYRLDIYEGGLGQKRIYLDKTNEMRFYRQFLRDREQQISE